MSGEADAGLRTGTSAKNPFIEVWRGIAVVLVVYFHYTGRLEPRSMGLTSGPTLPFYSGKVGVLIFFVISGYLITQSLAFSRNLGSFYAKRLSRIWPLFILAAVIIYASVHLFPPPVVMEGDVTFNRHSTNLVDLVGTFFFLEDFGIDWIDGAFWSILVELKFYLYVGIFAAVWPGRFAKKFAGAAFVIGFMQLFIFLAQPPHARLITGGLNRLVIADFLPFFAIGVLLCSKERGPLLTLNVLLAFIQTAITIASNPLFEAAATLRFLLAFAGVLAIDAALLRSRVFLFLGYYSYALYLFHQMIGLTIIAALAPRIGVDAAAAVAFAVALGLAVAGSWLVEWRFRDSFYRGLQDVFARIGLDRFAVGDRGARVRDLGTPSDATAVDRQG
jgi:peptidoglycan/LPS O-acetylase OafA/YrhL